MVQGLWLAITLTLTGLVATWNFSLQIIFILLTTLVFAGLLVPLEALGWWAGWYDDDLDIAINPGTLEEPVPANTDIRKYVIYLDGICQSQSEYLPEVELFLDELAAALPSDIAIIRGLMPYTVFNKPLTEDRWLSFLWRKADHYQMTASGGILGALIGATINIRNTLIVSVAGDQRYGPIYNQATAQMIYDSLIHHGYWRGCGIPVTLLGYSGGGQMAAGAAPYVKRALQAPIELVSLAGVISGNHNLLAVEHLYHIVGDKDLVEKEGPILFPRRWKLFFLSYWNRAKARGKISFISLGPVGHNAANGPYGAEARLPDGRTHLQQTVEVISGILQGSSSVVSTARAATPGNYEVYQQAAFNRPEFYPLNQTVDSDRYQAIAPWIGRLILPSLQERYTLRGVWFEVHHAPTEYQHLIGKVVPLCWSTDSTTQRFVKTVTKAVHFSQEAEDSQRQGVIHPDRLNHWQQVDPLESLAGARPNDDVIVALTDLVEVQEIEAHSQDQTPYVLRINREPLQITGRYYALVKILQVAEIQAQAATETLTATESPSAPTLAAPLTLHTSRLFRVAHYDRLTGQFDGGEEIIAFPQVALAKAYGSYPSTTHDIEKTLLNETGWYVYGAKDANGVFVVQAIAPRALFRLCPDQVIVGKQDSWHYLKKQAWQVKGEKGQIRSVMLIGDRNQGAEDSRPNHFPKSEIQNPEPSFPTAHSELQNQNLWSEGDRALVLHVYGGIGGKNREPAAKTPIFFGHFAYGIATVIREPLADELMFDIQYYQVYSHNIDGIAAGKFAWHRFMGDRQVGWLGTRPVCDVLIKLDSFTGAFNVYGRQYSVLNVLLYELEVMIARYRIGDGTGGTYVGPAHNCSQDSNQALYAALKRVRNAIESDPKFVEELQDEPGEAEQFAQLVKLTEGIRRELLPWGSARADWQNNEFTLGISPEEDFFQGVSVGLRSWRTLLPRLASEAIAKQFLDQGATIWVLRTNQIGGDAPDIEPIAPTPLGWL
ncbi:CAAX protease [Phormidium sp. CLA17]|uniref:CAAX protease n=1 Tax=Leptolyngbya sp. Cla-17 TaxID=2803751 RepID=UPI001932D9BC|nr:CAAX protease [Leptolyngbya sp. Cla-17]MBM0740333.1 CAAX protease [Leptolyngbya sp. Cla-17]